MVRILNIAGLFTGASPQKILDGLDEDTQQMCNIYAAAAQKSPIMVPDLGHIQEVMNSDARYFHLRGGIHASDIKSTVEAMDRKVIGHLVTQGGVQPPSDDADTADFARGTTFERLQAADGPERLKLIAYTSAVRFHDQDILSAEEIGDFLIQDPEFKSFFKNEEELEQYAQDVHDLVFDGYARHNPDAVIPFLLHQFPDPGQDSCEPA